MAGQCQGDAKYGRENGNPCPRHPSNHRRPPCPAADRTIRISKNVRHQNCICRFRKLPSLSQITRGTRAARNRGITEAKRLGADQGSPGTGPYPEADRLSHKEIRTQPIQLFQLITIGFVTLHHSSQISKTKTIHFCNFICAFITFTFSIYPNVVGANMSIYSYILVFTYFICSLSKLARDLFKGRHAL